MRSESDKAYAPVRRRRRRQTPSDLHHSDMSDQSSFPEPDRAAIQQNSFQFDETAANIFRPEFSTVQVTFNYLSQIFIRVTRLFC